MGDLIYVGASDGSPIFPEIKLRAAFGQNAYTASPTWTDLSSYLLGLNTFHGRNYETDDFEPGDATFTLRNDVLEFWPNNSSSPFYPDIQPSVRLQLYVVWNLTSYYLFTGFVESWGHDFLLSGGHAPIVGVTAVDLLKGLGKLNLNDGTGYSQERSDARFDNLLDDLGWPAAQRDLAEGQSTVVATGALEEVNALSHLRILLNSEVGQAWIAGDGHPQFHDRHARFKEPYLTSQMIFADSPGAGEFGYHGIEFEYDDQFIYNDIRIGRTGGTVQVASDATSQNTHGKRTFPLTNLIMTTDGEALDQANYRLAVYKNPAFRVNSVTSNPMKAPSTLWPKLLSRDVSDRVTVKYSPAGVDADFHVEGVRHQADAKSRQWNTTLRLSPVSAQTFWLAGVAGYSEAGLTTRPGY